MAYRSSTTNRGNSATPATAVPAGVAADDIVILAVAGDSTSIAVDPADWPAGFTELAEVSITLDGQRAAVGWKRLTGADAGSYTFGNVGVSTVWVCQAFAFSGRHLTDPPTASSATSNAGNASPVSINAATVTALAGDDVIWLSAPDVNTGFAGTGHSPPASYTERQDDEDTAFGFANLSGATRDNVGAGATGTVTGTFTMSSGTSGWAAFLVRIPAAAAAGDQNVSPPLVDGGATVFSPTVSPGAVTVSPPLVDGGAAAFGPTVTPGAVSVAPPLVDAGPVVYTPTVAPDGAVVAPPLVDAGASVPGPTVSAGAVTVAPPLVDGGAVVFAPTVALEGAAAAGGILPLVHAG